MKHISNIKKRTIELDMKVFSDLENSIVKKIIELEKEFVEILGKKISKTDMNAITLVDGKLASIIESFDVFVNLSLKFKHQGQFILYDFVTKVVNDVLTYARSLKLLENGFFNTFVMCQEQSKISKTLKENIDKFEKARITAHQNGFNIGEIELNFQNGNNEKTSWSIQVNSEVSLLQLENVIKINVYQNYINSVISIALNEKDITKIRYIVKLIVTFVNKLIKCGYISRAEKNDESIENTKVISQISQAIIRNIGLKFASFFDKIQTLNKSSKVVLSYFDFEFKFKDESNMSKILTFEINAFDDLLILINLTNLNEISNLVKSIFDSVALKKLPTKSEYFNGQHNIYFDENDVMKLEKELASYLQIFHGFLDNCQGLWFSNNVDSVSPYQIGLYLLLELYRQFKALGFEDKMIYASSYFYHVQDLKQFNNWFEFDNSLRKFWIKENEPLFIDDLKTDNLLSNKGAIFQISEDVDFRLVKLIKQNAYINKQIISSKSKLNYYHFLQFSVPFEDSYKQAIDLVEANHQEIVNLTKNIKDPNLKDLVSDEMTKSYNMFFESSTYYKTNVYKNFEKIAFKRSAREWVVLTIFLISIGFALRIIFHIITLLIT